MKRFILLRHSIAAAAGQEGGDYSRPLTREGIKQAKKISSIVRKKGIRPGLIISSPAERADETARIFARVLGYPRKEIVYTEQLYKGLDTRLVREIVTELTENEDSQIDSIMIVGHDPGITDCVRKYVRGFNRKVPACGIAVIDFEIDDWKNLKNYSGSLFLFEYPEDTSSSKTAKEA
jgi:phosphohistidine phosphatase